MTKKKSTRKKHQCFDSLSTPSRFSNWWIWIVIFLIAIQLVSSADLLRHDSKYENVNMSASSRARFRRDTTKLENAVQNLASLARITNGIALEIGLVDGSIQPGEAVSELLLMGDLKLEDIINLNQDSIDKVLDSLNQKPKTSEEIEKLEQRLISLEDVREISSNLQNLKEIPGKKEFEASFKAVEDMVAQNASLAATQSELTGLISAFVSLKTMVQKGFTEESRVDALHKLNGVAVGMDKVKAFQAAFEPVKELIKTAKKMSENSKFIDYLATENKFRTSEKVVYKDVTPLLLEKFKKVHEDSQAASSAQKEFESILKLVQTRSPLHRQTFHHTAGFPRGSDDLKGLEQSIEDPSVISRISNGESVKTHLKEALGLFKNLEKEIDGISSDWKSLEAEYKSVNEVVSTVVNLGKLPDVSQSISGTVDALVECDKGGYPTSKLDEGFATSIRTLGNQVNGLSSFDYLGSFPNLDSQKTSFETRGLALEKEPEFITNAFNKWKTDKTLKTFVDNVKKLDKDLKSVLAFLGTNPTNNIKLATLTQHLTGIANQEYTTFLKCVNDIQVKGFPVKSLIEFIRGSKNIQVPQGAKDAITKVTQSGSRLTSAQNVAGKFKGDVKLTPKIEVFKSSFEQKNYEEVSRKLGLGVQGLAAILKVRTAKIDDLVGMTENILNDAKTNGQSPERQKSLHQLIEVKKVLNSINTFLQTSKGLQAFRRKRNAGFESFQEIFRDAASVQGATIVMDNFREAIDALKNVKVSGVDELEALDLDFAKFNIGDAGPSLIAMDKFFEKYFTHFSGGPGPGNSKNPTKPGQKVPPASKDSLVETTTKSWHEEYFYVYIFVGVGILVALAAAIYFRKSLWGKWKKLTGKKPVKPPVPPSPEPTPVPVPAPIPVPPPEPVPAPEPVPVPPPVPPPEPVPAPAPAPAPALINPDPNRAPPNVVPNEEEDVQIPNNQFPEAQFIPGQGNRNRRRIARRRARQRARRNRQAAAPEARARGDPVPRAEAQQEDRQHAEDPPDAAADEAEGGQNDGGDAGDQPDGGPVAVARRPPPVPRWADAVLDEDAARRRGNSLKWLRLTHCNAYYFYSNFIKSIPPHVAAYRLFESLARPERFRYNLENNFIDEPTDNIRKKKKKMSIYLASMPKISGFVPAFINCNRVILPIGTYYVGQHPLDGTNGKDDTREIQLALIFQFDITIVAQLCGENETMAVYYPLEVGTDLEPNVLTFGRYSVRTTAITQGAHMNVFIEAGCFTLYDVDITDNEEQKTKHVQFLVYTGWPADRPPVSFKTPSEIIYYLDTSSENPIVLINCSDGLGKSGTLVTIKYGMHVCQQRDIEKLYDVISFVRDRRFDAVSTALECVYAVLAIARGIMHQRGIGFYRDFWVIVYYYEKILQGEKYEFLTNSNNEALKNEFIEDDVRKMCDYCDVRESDPAEYRIPNVKRLGIVPPPKQPKESWKEKKKRERRVKKHKDKKGDSKKIRRHIPLDEQKKIMRKYRDK